MNHRSPAHRRCMQQASSQTRITATAFLCLACAVQGTTLVGQESAVGVATLSSEGSLPGQLVPRKNQQNGNEYAIIYNEGLKLSIPAQAVRRIKARDEVLAEYRKRALAAGDDADAHYALHQWCYKNGLHDQMNRHLERAIEIQPNHSESRAALGYQLHDSQWVKSDNLYRQRGMVRDGGKWRFAEEVIVLDGEEKLSEAREDWRSKIRQWQRAALKNNPRGLEARASLAQINDPTADVAVVEAFNGATDVNEQLFWLDSLKRLSTGICVDTIIQASMNSMSADVREACYEYLQGPAKFRAISYYLSFLGSKDNLEIRRAGRALSYVNDPEIALQLIKALNTSHETEVRPAGAGLNVNANGGLSAGGNKRVVRTDVKQNTEVLDALLEIVPEDVNYQFDETRWLQYYAAKLSPAPGDLRRDP